MFGKNQKVSVNFNRLRKILVFSFTDCPCGMSLEEYLKNRNELKAQVEYVFFDRSFRDFYPRSVEGWFRGFRKIKKFFGLENFRTKRIKNYRSMFEGCSSLEELNLMCFEPASKIDIADMFAGCSGLKEIQIPKEYRRPEACLPVIPQISEYFVIKNLNQNNKNNKVKINSF